MTFPTPSSILITALFLLLALCQSAEAETALTPDRVGVHDLTLRDVGDGEWEVRTTGTDPYFFVRTDGRAIDLKREPMLAFQYFSTTGVGRMLVFVGPVLDIPRLITRPDMGVSEGWANLSVNLTATPQPPTAPVTSLRVTLGDHPGIIVRLRGICTRAATEEETWLAAGRAALLEQDHEHGARLAAYLQTPFEDQITSVSADNDRIRIEGQIAPKPGGLLLAEVPLWADVTQLTAPETLLPVTNIRDCRFVMAVSRKTAEGRDRLLSAWAVVRRVGDHYEPLSAMHYVTAEKARANLSPAHPRSRKGLGGCPFTSPDMEALGVSSVTLNIILNDIIFTTPGPKRTRYPYAGRTWWIDDGSIASYDASMKTAAEHGWMVSAIILMPPPGTAPPGSWIRMAAHPDADPAGIFVLPNFTSRAGVEAYAAVMNFLAERYSRPDGKFGRIHDWIMYNEINAGYFWANAGTKTLLTYMDLYQKSMRLTYLIARQYDPNAKPLISLDHCWTHIPDVRCFAGCELLQKLVLFSHKEGDFKWGIAFHPYPQDITNPRTWEDRDATPNFDTPFITFKNIEVLNEWAEQPDVAFHGVEPREIQLTEEGFNSPDYSEKSLQEQAAGLVYAWNKIEPLKNITAFQYHLWRDDHSEGGLRLGLRKFADDAHDPGGKKPIWSVFQAIGREGWEKASGVGEGVVGEVRERQNRSK